MNPGTYDAVVRVAATGAEAKAIRASLIVKPRPRLAIDKSSIAFAANLGDTVPMQTVAITSVDGAIDSLNVGKPDCGSSPAWIAATLSHTRAPTTLALTVLPGSLGAGTHSCSVTLTTSQTLVDSASQTIRVSLTLKAVPRLSLSIDTLRTSAVRTTDAPTSIIQIKNSGTGSLSDLSVGAIAYGAGGSGWITATLDSTTAPASVTLRPTARNLPAGTYSGSVEIRSSVDGVAPRTVVVVFQVIPIPSVLVASPAQFAVSVKQGVGFHQRYSGILTHSGDARLTNVAFGTPPLVMSALLAPLSVSLVCSGTFPGPTPCQFQVQIDVDPWTAVGTYPATIAFFAYDAKVGTTIPVRIVVTP
jgi:hypothetical protein